MREAEALEVEHAERVHDRLGAGRGFKMVAGELGREAAEAKSMERVRGGLIVRRGGPAGEGAVGHEQLGRIEGGQDGEEISDRGIGRDAELAGG